MPEYHAPLWDSPLDTDAYIRATPEGAVIKGMFPGAVAAEARRRGLTLANAGDKYLAFLDYPLIEHNRLLVEAATAFWPDGTVRQGLRKLGRAAVTSFMDTTFGKAVLGGITQPDTVARALGALVRAYTTTLSKPTPHVEVIETGESSALLKFRDAWVFLDSQQVGIIEGVCRVCGVRGDVRLAMDGMAAGEFLCTWDLGPLSRPPP